MSEAVKCDVTVGGPGAASDAAFEAPSDETAARGVRRVLANAASLLGAYALPRACSFAATVVAARVLGVATFGAYGTAAAVAVILSIVATLGMMQLLVRELARAPERAPELIGAANLAKAGSAALMLAALAFLVRGPLGLAPEVQAAAMLLGLSYAVGAWAENLGAYFQGIERMGVWMEAQALFGVVTGLAGIGLALATRSLVWFCVAPVLGQAAALAWLLVRAPAEVRTAWRAPGPVVAGLLRELAPFAAAFVAMTAYYKLDIVLVERWSGAGEAGIYAAAYKFVDVGHALALVLVTAVYPRLSRAAPRTGEGETVRGAGRRWAATRATELMLLAGVPAAAVLWLLRGPVVTGLFGGDYAAGVGVLGLLAPALPALAVNMLGIYVLGAAGRMGAVAALYGVAIPVAVTLDWLLIPAWGADGAAVAKLAAELVLVVAMLRVLGVLASAAPGLRTVGAAAAAAAAAAALDRFSQGGSLSAAASAMLTVGMYLACVTLLYAAFRAVPRRELRLLGEAIR